MNFAIPGLQEIQSPVSDGLNHPINLPPHFVGNTEWIGIDSIGPIRDGTDPMPSPLAAVRMEFYRRQDVFCKDPELVLSSTESQISIDDAEAWLLTVPKQELPLEPGFWEWSMFFVDADERELKLYDGSIIVTT